MTTADSGLGARMLSALSTLAAQLDGAGVAGATWKPGAVQVPGCWLSPRTTEVTTLNDSGTFRVDIFLVVPDNGEEWPALMDLLDKTLTVVDADEPIDLAAPLLLPHSTSPLPGIRVPVDVAI